MFLYFIHHSTFIIHNFTPFFIQNMRNSAIIMIAFVATLASLPFPLTAQSKNNSKTIDSGYAEVNQTKLYYEIAGKGEPLILIHGSFGDRRFWDLQFYALSKKYKVLRYDLRGFGRSQCSYRFFRNKKSTCMWSVIRKFCHH